MRDLFVRWATGATRATGFSSAQFNETSDQPPRVALDPGVRATRATEVDAGRGPVAHVAQDEIEWATATRTATSNENKGLETSLPVLPMLPNASATSVTANDASAAFDIVLSALVYETFASMAAWWIEGAVRPGREAEAEIEKAWCSGDRAALQRSLDAYVGACLRACRALSPCEHAQEIELIRWRLEHPDYECARCWLEKWG